MFIIYITYIIYYIIIIPYITFRIVCWLVIWWESRLYTTKKHQMYFIVLWISLPVIIYYNQKYFLFFFTWFNRNYEYILGFDKLLVHSRPLKKLCEFDGKPLPEDYKSDCFQDVDETEYACKEKYRIMVR